MTVFVFIAGLAAYPIARHFILRECARVQKRWDGARWKH